MECLLPDIIAHCGYTWLLVITASTCSHATHHCNWFLSISIQCHPWMAKLNILGKLNTLERTKRQHFHTNVMWWLQIVGWCHLNKKSWCCVVVSLSQIHAFLQRFYLPMDNNMTPVRVLNISILNFTPYRRSSRNPIVTRLSLAILWSFARSPIFGA